MICGADRVSFSDTILRNAASKLIRYTIKRCENHAEMIMLFFKIGHLNQSNIRSCSWASSFVPIALSDFKTVLKDDEALLLFVVVASAFYLTVILHQVKDDTRHQ